MVPILGMFCQKWVSMLQMDEKIFHGLNCTSIKTTQFDIKKCITWPKKFGKVRGGGREGWNETWDKASMDLKLRLRKLNTLVKTK